MMIVIIYRLLMEGESLVGVIPPGSLFFACPDLEIQAKEGLEVDAQGVDHHLQPVG